MIGALIILGVTLLTGLILYLARGKEDTASEMPANVTSGESEADEDGANVEPEACCGRHAVCEKGLLKAEELYYNDEELDRYTGREPDGYTSEEIEEFREVLYTLRPDEVYQWGIALTQRNIPLPVSLRDEWVMLCN